MTGPACSIPVDDAERLPEAIRTFTFVARLTS